MADSPIRIAIIGGGLAGASLANALLQVQHLDVHVFEADTQFSERGAAISIPENALNALQCIIPGVRDLLVNRAGAVPMNTTRAIIGCGPNARSLVFEGRGDNKLAVHRASLLREFLAPLSATALHPGKPLTKIDQVDEAEGSALRLTFHDGEARDFDAVIGADGIFGVVRRYVLEGETDGLSATPAGFWDCRNLVPIEKARALLGEEYFEEYRQYGWVGDKAFLMHDVVENGTLVQCVISGIEQSATGDSRAQPLDRSSLERALHEWAEGPITDGMIELILDQPEPKKYAQWEHKSTPTYAKGNICIVGDAAHAATPWQGVGAGQAFEDAVVLGALLRQVTTVGEMKTAFRAFDAVRRPRCERVVASSHMTGKIVCGQGEAGLDPDGLRKDLAPRWDFLFNFSLESHQQEALDTLRDLQSRERQTSSMHVNAVSRQ